MKLNYYKKHNRTKTLKIKSKKDHSKQIKTLNNKKKNSSKKHKNS